MTFAAWRLTDGSPFFVGISFCLCALLLGAWVRRRWGQAAANVLASTGILFVIASSTPLPWWIYLVWCALLLAWLTIPRSGSVAARRARWIVSGLVAVTSVGMVSAELPYRLGLALRLPGEGTLCVVGDSLSMGADAKGGNWPDLLGARAGLSVQNLSFGGARVATALHNAKQIGRSGVFVFVEIGGNDVLAGSAPAEFEQGLNDLLGTVCTRGRSVAMFELPLPPFYNRYAAIQRRLAHAHGVLLIPKRFLAGVLATPGATVDGLHLSGTGHKLLSDRLWCLSRPFDAAP
jgi:lysophospholipase L1-like esterase